MGYALNTILANQLISRIVPHVQPIKKLISYDLPDLSRLPPGQRRAIQSLIGGEQARTYTEAALLAGMSEGTMLTHVNRVRRRHPRIYKNVRKVRLAQLALRHEEALANAREHSREYFRNVNRSLYRILGYRPW